MYVQGMYDEPSRSWTNCGDSELVFSEIVGHRLGVVSGDNCSLHSSFSSIKKKFVNFLNGYLSYLIEKPQVSSYNLSFIIHYWVAKGGTAQTITISIVGVAFTIIIEFLIIVIIILKSYVGSYSDYITTTICIIIIIPVAVIIK